MDRVTILMPCPVCDLGLPVTVEMKMRWDGLEGARVTVITEVGAVHDHVKEKHQNLPVNAYVTMEG